MSNSSESPSESKFSKRKRSVVKVNGMQAIASPSTDTPPTKEAGSDENNFPMQPDSFDNHNHQSPSIMSNPIQDRAANFVAPPLPPPLSMTNRTRSKTEQVSSSTRLTFDPFGMDGDPSSVGFGDGMSASQRGPIDSLFHSDGARQIPHTRSYSSMEPTLQALEQVRRSQIIASQPLGINLTRGELLHGQVTPPRMQGLIKGGADRGFNLPSALRAGGRPTDRNISNTFSSGTSGSTLFDRAEPQVDQNMVPFDGNKVLYCSAGYESAYDQRSDPPLMSTPMREKQAYLTNEHSRQATNSTIASFGDRTTLSHDRSNEMENLRRTNEELREGMQHMTNQLEQLKMQLQLARQDDGPDFEPLSTMDAATHSALMANGRPFLPQTAPETNGFDGGDAQSRQPLPLPFRSAMGSVTQPPAKVVRSDSNDRWAALREEGRGTPPLRRARSSVPQPELPADALVTAVLSLRAGQDTSIMLQQQLKSADDGRKREIINAMKPKLFALSQDKHGNFLVQRAIGIDPSLAWVLEGKFVELALSQFGCHVVQRVLDEDEPTKLVVVQELLKDRLLQTFSARSAVHIWQKTLEITWTHATFRATLFQTINDHLRGRWAETAMQETGSIICQNIFESADANEKRECISEILLRIPDCANNQWGVWVVQHIIDHGAEKDRKVVFQRLLERAVDLTLSQYGQKAVMTALKTNDADFMVPYVDILCSKGEGSPQSASSSRRSVLIDIACVQQGFNIVTQLLTNVDAEQRERLIATVRRNSVFLKGSKAGLRVHTLCERARAYSGY